jgi:hypothetical protein
MFENHYKKIAFLNELGISNEEFSLLHYINLSKEHGKGKDTKFNLMFQDYYNHNKSIHNYGKMLYSLKEKGYVTFLEQDGSISFGSVVILPKFIDSYHVDMDKCWEEVRQMFPLRILINDSYIPAQTTKSLTLKEDYYRVVTNGGDKHKHHEFLSLVELYYYGNSTTAKKERKSSRNIGLERFIASWDAMRDTIKLMYKIGEEGGVGESEIVPKTILF